MTGVGTTWKAVTERCGPSLPVPNRCGLPGLPVPPVAPSTVVSLDLDNVSEQSLLKKVCERVCVCVRARVLRPKAV